MNERQLKRIINEEIDNVLTRKKLTEGNNRFVNNLAEKITDTYYDTQDITIIGDALIQGLEEVYLPEDEDSIPGYDKYNPPYNGFITDLDLLEINLVREFKKLKQKLYIKSGH